MNRCTADSHAWTDAGRLCGPRIRSNTMRAAYLVLFVAVLAGGCATQSTSLVQKPFDSIGHRSIRIMPCVDRSGTAGDRDLGAELRSCLSAKIREKGPFQIREDAPLVLTCDIESFAEGSALKRWVMPGWGTTQATVSVMLLEKPEDTVIATFRSHSEVGMGGLYTIGADQYILDVACADIVKQLRKWADTSGSSVKPGLKPSTEPQPGVEQ